MLASLASRKGPGERPAGERPPSEPAWSIFGVRCSQGPESEPELPSREELFDEVPLVEFLALDHRPVFVVDLLTKSPPPTANGPPSLPIVYYNPALYDAGPLLDVVAGRKAPSPYGQPAWVTYPAFRAWTLDHGMQRTSSKRKASIVFGGIKWSAATLRRRWKMLYGDVYRHNQHLTASFSNVYYSTKSVGWVEENNVEESKENPVVREDEVEDTEGVEDIEGVEEMGNEPRPRRMSLDALKAGRRLSIPPPVSAIPLTPGTSTLFCQSSLPSEVRYDWTCTPPPPNLAPFVQSICDKDWSSTPLGPISTWSPTLRFMCNMLTACPSPAILFWGKDMTIIYNEPYIPLAGDKHPSLMGSSPWVSFEEAWGDFEPFLRSCEESGCGAMVENMLLFISRGAIEREEMYYSFNFTPILEEDKIVGWYEVVFETSNQMITERRVSTLLALSDTLAASENRKAFWRHCLDALDTNPQDVGFAVVYSVTDVAKEGEASSSKRYELEGSLGVPDGHSILATRLDVTLGRDGFTPYFRAAAESKKPLLLSLEDGSLPEGIMQGIESRAWNEPVNSVVICAIRPTTGHADTRDTALGFLIIGLNSHLPYNAEYRKFIQLLNRQITTSLASVVLLEEETRRGRTIAEQAALDQQKIEELLLIRTRELEQSELQLKHFADAVPTGIFVLEFTPENMDGTYRYRNERWFELMGDSRENTPGWKSPLWQQMHPDDLDSSQKAWKKLLQAKSEQRFEFRIPRVHDEQRPMEEESKFTWILCHAFSVVTDDGWLRSIVGSVTDITAIKWAEGVQKRKMEDAIEAKRQQENFIDVTSHEMRNPLSAIMISADDIITSLGELDQQSDNFTSVIENSIDAAQTVLHCAQHQKRIVDDILTISKLDSGLFTINPVEVQPTVLLRDLYKMFAGEYNAAGITQTTIIKDSFKSLEIDCVLLDSSRLTQILINLITNSIKFTQYQEQREIKISLGASKERPTESAEGIEYLDFRTSREDLTQRKEWGDGEELYLHFSVADTGCGLTVDEKKLLFMRFSQAPRTMVHYGGSGLGLFICRELTELQGGAIGVESESGKGSTFAFYIKARRRVAEEHPDLAMRQANQTPEPTALHQLQNLEQTFEQPRTPRQDENMASLYNNSTRSSSPASTRITTTTTSTTQVTPPPSIPCSPRVFDCLIVEDNKVNQAVMSKGLVKLGHAVYVANHGVEALDFLRTTQYWYENGGNAQNLSVVLMDIEMPVMDGLTCVKRIRELEREGKLVGRVKVIAITANARIEQVNTALEAGMDDVVSKPFRVAELISSIERLVDSMESQGP